MAIKKLLAKNCVQILSIFVFEAFSRLNEYNFLSEHFKTPVDKNLKSA
jgi:hypothetical protein